ncbi:MAG TPA: methyltransferase domain-containing protein [Gaiellaceae bacterium]|nr:methyltransferase domain-containing protein [Gaiellaceae bacterium]
MEPTEENVRAFDARHRADEGARGLPAPLRDRLPDLRGRHVLHLGCGTGEGTLELAALGGLVTAVEPDVRLLEVARNREPSAAAAWLESPLDALPLELQRGRFHLVLADGNLRRVADLAAWAHGIEAALRDGGYLLLHDEHPVLRCVDPLLHWRDDYREGTTVGAVVSAVARAGLVVRRVEELPAARPRERVPGELVLVARK